MILPPRLKAIHVVATIVCLTFLVSLNLLRPVRMQSFPKPDQTLIKTAIELRSSLKANESIVQNQRNCNHYIDRAVHPGTHFLNATSPTHITPTTKIPSEIFFLHYNQQLENPKYLCSIESAARQNPHHTIRIHAKNPVAFQTAISKWKSALPSHMRNRIAIIPLDWERAMLQTPLEQWWLEQRWKESKWVDQNLGNAFRLGILYKRGGVYLDLDILSLNPVGAMGRSIVMQDPNRMNNAFFSVERRDAFMWAVMEEFVNTFQGYTWGYNGPDMVTRAYEKNCKSQSPHLACEGLSVAPMSRMFPIQYENRGSLFDRFTDQCNVAAQFADEAVGVHYWNKRTQYTGLSNKTMLAVMMKLACPVVFEAFSQSELQIHENGVLGGDEYYKVEKQDVF